MDRPHHMYLDLFLKRLSARSDLNEEERQAILDLPTHAVQLAKKRDFLHVNEETSHACLIVAGMVARFNQLSNGARQSTALHIPGDMIDLHSAVRPIGIGGLQALSDTTILRVPHSAIRVLASRFPAIAEAFWRDCVLDAAILMQWVVNVGKRDAKSRIAHLLCEMAVRSDQDCDAAMNYDFPLTQEQLGEATALTSVHVNRSLKLLDDLASVKRGKVQIHHWNALRNQGNFDPTYLIADTVRQR